MGRQGAGPYGKFLIAYFYYGERFITQNTEMNLLQNSHEVTTMVP